MIVVPDIVTYADLQLVKIIEFVKVKELGFERAEEALHGGIVAAVSPMIQGTTNCLSNVKDNDLPSSPQTVQDHGIGATKYA
jgi:hypothetical protein